MPKLQRAANHKNQLTLLTNKGDLKLWQVRITKYNNINALIEFNTNFTKQFGLGLYFWGLLIVVFGVVAGVAVMLIFAKTFDRATEREQRRSARLNALKKEEKVVAEQPAEVVEPKAE